nr:pyridoxamine 5'-phosphate oxidase family protein [Deltaproteobacteria bacterium]
MKGLRDYFENKRGTGVMSTADKDGKVNASIYSRPHFMEDGSVAFIMSDRLTHHNLLSNPHAAYLFMEEGLGYKGKRLYLTKIREEKNKDLIQSLSRRGYRNEKTGARFLVVFQVDKVMPLIGAGDETEG